MTKNTITYYKRTSTHLIFEVILKLIILIATTSLALVSIAGISWVLYECVSTYEEDPGGNILMASIIIVLGLFPYFLIRLTIKQINSWQSKLTVLEGSISELSFSASTSSDEITESGRTYYCFVEDQGYAEILPNHYNELKEGQWIKIKMTKLREVRKIEIEDIN